MAIIRTTTKPAAETKNRYSGKEENAQWTVKSPHGVVQHKWTTKDKTAKPFESAVYTEVEAAARAYTLETGIFAQAVRV